MPRHDDTPRSIWMLELIMFATVLLFPAFPFEARDHFLTVSFDARHGVFVRKYLRIVKRIYKASSYKMWKSGLRPLAFAASV
jgi:hypothetical protein